MSFFKLKVSPEIHEKYYKNRISKNLSIKGETMKSMLGALRGLLRDTTLTRPFYMVSRRVYLFVRRMLHSFLTRFFRITSKSKGYKYFHWRGLKLKESWNDPYKVGSILYNLRQFTDMAAMVEKLTGPSPVIFDIGANIGTYSIACGDISGSTIHSFEPVFKTFEMLKQNVEDNYLTNIKVYNLGISNFCSEQNIKTSRKANVDSGAFSVQLTNTYVSLTESEDRETSEVSHFTTLDEFIESHNISKIDLIKARIQGEGHEVSVFKGGQLAIEKLRPIIHIIYSQELYEKNQVSTDVLISTAENFDYDVYVYNDIAASLSIIDPPTFFSRRSSEMVDLMFIPSE